jgi:hypothetical protein
MHPDLLGALAHERRAEILRQHQFRHRQTFVSATRAHGTTRPAQRVRLSVGAALVAAGTRLIGNGSARVDVVSSRR